MSNGLLSCFCDYRTT